MKSTKKILTTTLSLVLMMLVLGTGVFAWFTINTKTSATGLSGTAEAADGGFYIKLADDDNWTDVLDLSGVAKGIRLKDITTQDGINFTDLEGNNAEEGQWIEFDLEFITGSTYTNIYLEELTIKTTKSTTWVSEVTTDDESFKKGDEIKGYLGDAIRVSLEGDNTVIIEKEEDSTESDNTIGFGGRAMKYYNAIYPNKQINETSAPSRTDIVANTLLTDPQKIVEAKTDINGIQKVTFNGGETTQDLDASFTKTGKITVRVWLEGWDGEAFNAVANGEVKIDFKFRAKEA